MTCNKCEALQRILVQQDKDDSAWRKQVLELQAHINDLRDALDEMVAMEELEGNSCEPQRHILSKTAPQCLQEREAKEKWEASLVAECTDPNQ